MTTAEPAIRPDRSLPRFSLALVGGLHAGVFGWAARSLPWQDWTPLAIAAGALALLHAATAILALVRASALLSAWRTTAIASLLFLAWTALSVVTSAFYLATLYDGLGRGVAAAIFFASSGVVLFTLPYACWGLARTGRAASKSLLTVIAVAGVAVVGLGLWRSAAAATARPAAAARGDSEQLVARIAALVPEQLAADATIAAPALDASAPADCELPVDETADATVVIHSITSVGTAVGEVVGPNSDPEDRLPGAAMTRDRRDALKPDRRRRRRRASDLVARVDCVQGRGTALDVSIRAILDRALPGVPVKIDWIRASAPIPATFEIVEPLALRPGLDGACIGGRCLMPWQLLLADQFRAIRPLEMAPDLSFGISSAALRRAIGAASGPIVRIEVESLLVDRNRRTLRLERLRPAAPERSADRFARASRAAQRHVEVAQRHNGGFRYLQSPVRWRSVSKRTSLPRHAGTTAALCELGSGDDDSRRAARRALARLAKYERRSPSGSFLARNRRRDSAAIGDSALPLIALLRCSAWTNGEFDAVARRLGAGLRSLQRNDGSFAPGFDLVANRPLAGHAPLYADGQAILALTLLERLEDGDAANGAAAGELHAAVERAMDRVANDYWNHPLRDFFFIEENWHCLAAQAALAHHRNAGYEQFCLDYMRFRSRFVLTADDGVAWDFVGGLGFGNLLPPQTVPTAGFAEALTAAIAILDARGDDSTEARQLLAATLDFLLERQWTAVSCFACKRPERIVGGFSESMISPLLRIDQTQHAWAALGHGARILGLEAVQALNPQPPVTRNSGREGLSLH